MATRRTSRQAARRRPGSPPLGCRTNRAIAASCAIEPLEDRRLLALVTVDTLDDTVDFNDGLTSLREAIFATNLVGGPDTIDFAPSLTAGGPATILLTQGELKITDALTITGPGADLLTIDASGNDPTPNLNDGKGSRLFHIDNGSSSDFIDVTISGIAMTGGDWGGDFGLPIGPTENGGAVWSRENLTLQSVTIAGNFTRGWGGGIYHDTGMLRIVGSITANNTGEFRGGGIYADGRAVVIIENTTIADNATMMLVNNGGGGGIQIVNSSLTVINSRVVDNSSKSSGGGIAIRLGILKIDGSEITGNSVATDGGGVYAIESFGSDVTISECTIIDNTATLGGGVYYRSFGNMTIDASQLRENSATVSGNLGHGGGLYVADGEVVVKHSTITGNTATGDGGGLASISRDHLSIQYSTLAENTAGGAGGGIWRSTRRPDAVIGTPDRI